MYFYSGSIVALLHGASKVAAILGRHNANQSNKQLFIVEEFLSPLVFLNWFKGPLSPGTANVLL